MQSALVKSLKSFIAPAAIGTVIYCANVTFSHIYSNYISPHLYSCITINSTNVDEFNAVLEYIQHNNLLHTNHLMLCRQYSDDPGSNHIKYELAATDQLLTMRFNGRIIYISRMVESIKTTRFCVSQENVLTLSVFGKDPTIIKTFISAAIDYKNTRESIQTGVYVCTDEWHEKWTRMLGKTPRTFDSLILEGTLAQDLFRDMRAFLDLKGWYENMGIPHRRGYLFYGPPGGGKTSLCQVLAGELKLHICILSVSGKSMTDSKLAHLMRNTPPRSIVVLEDVDSIFVKRETQGEQTTSVTFSGLLNVIDGFVSPEGRIFIMTTNHIKKLDPALIRPGRCDVKLEIKNASREQMVGLFLRFFPGRDAEAHSFVNNIPERKVSMAQLQNHLVQHRESPELAVDTAAQIGKVEEGFDKK
jgi:chaperone BCS1